MSYAPASEVQAIIKEQETIRDEVISPVLSNNNDEESVTFNTKELYRTPEELSNIIEQFTIARQTCEKLLVDPFIVTYQNPHEITFAQVLDLILDEGDALPKDLSEAERIFKKYGIDGNKSLQELLEELADEIEKEKIILKHQQSLGAVN